MQKMVSFKLTPAEAASAFCEMSAKEQALFFAHVAKYTEAWDIAGRVMQAHAVGRTMRAERIDGSFLQEIVSSMEEEVTP